MQRVDKLEQENTDLKGENEQLKAQADYLKAETKACVKTLPMPAVDVAKVKGTDWESKITLKGDVRYRHEEISDDSLSNAAAAGQPANPQQTADRYRDRYSRARIAEREGDRQGVGRHRIHHDRKLDPRSGNQSLNGAFSKKALDLDLAYFDWKFASWGDADLGKMKQPFFKPGQSYFWDNDITPEGMALNFNSGIVFGTAYGTGSTKYLAPKTPSPRIRILFGGSSA